MDIDEKLTIIFTVFIPCFHAGVKRSLEVLCRKQFLFEDPIKFSVLIRQKNVVISTACHLHLVRP